MSTDADLKYIFKDKLNLSEWKKYKTKEDYVYCGVPIPGLRQEVYTIERGGILISVGVFYYYNTLTYIAWGEKDAVHCAYHAPVSEDGDILEVRDGCPDVQPTKSNGGAVVGFTLDGAVCHLC